MNRAVLVAAAGSAGAVLVLAQYALPQWTIFHDWRYAALLALAAIPLVRVACSPGRAAAGRALRLAALGALIVVAAGAWSGLAGADTETITGAPGTRIPLPALGTTIAFAAVSDVQLAAGTAVVGVQRGGTVTEIGVRPHVAGSNVFFLQSRPAARIEARDLRGNRLTVTQPSNAAFLSDVLLFRSEQAIRDQRVPLDSFALPAEHVAVRALYFTPDQLAAFRHGVAPGAPALVLSAADDRGRPLGIAIAAAGQEVTLGPVRVRAILGRYPALAVGSAPHPVAVGIGFGLFAIAGLWPRFARRGLARPVLDPDLT